MTGVNIDITDRRAAEERLQRADKLESIGSLAGGMAHDYNNLMSIILLHADTAIEELSIGASAVDSVAAIRDAAERAVELGRQLMASAANIAGPGFEHKLRHLRNQETGEAFNR
jgi:signal transduction histidine kinase